MKFQFFSLFRFDFVRSNRNDRLYGKCFQLEWQYLQENRSFFLIRQLVAPCRSAHHFNCSEKHSLPILGTKRSLNRFSINEIISNAILSNERTVLFSAVYENAMRWDTFSQMECSLFENVCWSSVNDSLKVLFISDSLKLKMKILFLIHRKREKKRPRKMAPQFRQNLFGISFNCILNIVAFCLSNGTICHMKHAQHQEKLTSMKCGRKANQFFFCFVYHSSNSIIAALVLASALVFVYCKVGFGSLSSPNKLIVWKWKHRNDVELHSPKEQQTKTTSELQRHKNKTVTATDK